MMVKLFRAAVLLACSLYAGCAFAGTYYIASNGSDSNNGTSQSTPWLHAPGMPNCTASCRSHTPVPGDRFIFRGGDTWHEGNSSASPYTGSAIVGNGVTSGWILSWNGSSGNPIYWGVDQSWFNSSVCGSSWCRPILSGDNPTSTSGVASCTYDESMVHMLAMDTLKYTIVDNFELTGMCWSSVQSGQNCCMSHISANQADSRPSYNIVEHNYIHGWTHRAYDCVVSGGEPSSGTCDGAFGLNFSSNSTYGQGDQIIYNVLDGSDTDQQSLAAIAWGGYNIGFNYIGHTGNGYVGNSTHEFHDNLIEYLAQSGDGEAHTNAFEFNSEWNGTNAVYNNVLRNIFVKGGGVVQWMTPASGQTDYYFNNVVYAQSSNGNYFDACQPRSSSCPNTTNYTINVFNNTWALPESRGIRGPESGATINFTNNECISPGGGTAANCYINEGGTLNYATNAVVDPLVASAQGYLATANFAFAPTSSSKLTVGLGSNLSKYCSALAGAGLPDAAAACQSDTGYACNYNVGTHSVSCPVRTLVTRPKSNAWDIGAYQYSTSTGPQPPSSLLAAPH